MGLVDTMCGSTETKYVDHGSGDVTVNEEKIAVSAVSLRTLFTRTNNKRNLKSYMRNILIFTKIKTLSFTLIFKCLRILLRVCIKKDCLVYLPFSPPMTLILMSIYKKITLSSVL